MRRIHPIFALPLVLCLMGITAMVGDKFAGTLAPNADNTYDLGASGKTWSDIYGNAIKDTDADARLTFANNAATVINGNLTSNGSAIAVKIANSNALSTAGDKVAGFYAGTIAGTQVAYVDKDGSLGGPTATLQTCGSGIVNLMARDATGGTGGAATKLCICVLEADGTTFRWRNLLNAAAVTGNTTTCPNTI